MTANAPVATSFVPNRDLLPRRFTARVSKLGVTVERLTALDAVANLAADLAATVAPDLRRVVLAPALEQTYPALRQHLEARGITPTAIDVTYPAATFGPQAVGISAASLGVAETGSYVIADALADRLVRMLAYRHIVVLDVARLVPGLDEAGAWLRDHFTGNDGHPAGQYASFITGPSRTADIEMSLSVGAHGPAELRIVLLDSGAASERENGGTTHAGE
ncbi:MAG: lactate utilization protein [Thermomicrobia bacterium]|nr:lactate utilization protein [Thermomicrobia bacterium]MCA1722915.1 lactate utilization protein [Thermomicrobia bacterium]